MAVRKICFRASRAPEAQESLSQLEHRYGNEPAAQADVIVALGGDGFMLETLHEARKLRVPVYGMHRGTVGFLMNEFREEDLGHRLSQAEVAVIHPLRMIAHSKSGEVIEALAINEVSLLRQGPQAARLRITIDGKLRMPELVCDGALVSTPAGSTAYNHSAHGPILPIGANILALTAISAFRPRRWRGALVPMTSRVRIDSLDSNKRPISAVADSEEARDVDHVEVGIAFDISHRILFDPGHGLEERLIREQFV